jgi:hypothetical protein
VTVELRPPRREDAAAIAEALNEFNRPVGFDLDSAEEVAVWLEFPSLDLAEDARRSRIKGQDDYVSERFEDWLHWVNCEPFDPSLWFLAFDGDQLAGISLCRGEWYEKAMR